MDFFDILQQADINQLRGEIDRLRRHGEGAGANWRTVATLVEENLELKLRLGLLVRLLIAKGIVSAEEFAGLLAAARVTS